MVNFADIEVLFVPYVQGKAMAEMMNHVPGMWIRGSPGLWLGTVISSMGCGSRTQERRGFTCLSEKVT